MAVNQSIASNNHKNQAILAFSLRTCIKISPCYQGKNSICNYIVFQSSTALKKHHDQGSLKKKAIIQEFAYIFKKLLHGLHSSQHGDRQESMTLRQQPKPCITMHSQETDRQTDTQKHTRTHIHIHEMGDDGGSWCGFENPKVYLQEITSSKMFTPPNPS